MDKRYDKRTRRTLGRPQSGNTHQITQKTLKRYQRLEDYKKKTRKRTDYGHQKQC